MGVSYCLGARSIHTRPVLFRGGTRYDGAMRHNESGSALRSSLITVGIIAALLVIAFMMLPRGFSDDLSHIGQGGNVVVLTHNKEAVQSLDLMTLMNKVRGDYDGRIEFLAVDIDTEAGQTFMERERIGGSALLLFGPDGARRGVLVSVRDEQTLRAALDNAFGISR